jgi:hypothetical protein
MDAHNEKRIEQILDDLRADYKTWTMVNEDLCGDATRLPVKLEVLMDRFRSAFRRLAPICGVPPNDLPGFIIEKVAGAASDVPLCSEALMQLLEAMQDEARDIGDRVSAVAEQSIRSLFSAVAEQLNELNVEAATADLQSQGLERAEPPPPKTAGKLIEDAVEKFYGTYEELAQKADVEPRILYRIRNGERVNSRRDRKGIAAAVSHAGFPCTPEDFLNPSSKRGRGRPPKNKQTP